MGHVVNNSGKVEWYTPPEIIMAARSLMGSIDLDPASCERANEVVGAGRFISREEDALWPGTSWECDGSVWINPPYTNSLISGFANRLMWELHEGSVKRALWISNNATETDWGQKVISSSVGVCLLKRRVRFLDENLMRTGTPLQGQMIVALGDIEPVGFESVFSGMGMCLFRGARN